MFKFKNLQDGGTKWALKMVWVMPTSLLFLVGCATSPPINKSRDASAAPETMLVSYHVKAGKEAAFQDALARTWIIYSRDKLVFATPHLVVREKDDSGRTRFVESFTWVNHAAPDHAPPGVKVIWKELESLCEPRDGKKGIDGDEVETIVAH
jgi:hypothetical protein